LLWIDCDRAGEAMVDLTIQDVRWSREQGHPVLVMSAEASGLSALSIVLSPGDARLLSPNPAAPGVERSRLVALVEAMARAFGATLSEVRFHLDAGMVLSSDLHFSIDGNEVRVAANFADAVIFAQRAGVPMRISKSDLVWIKAMQSPEAATTSSVQPPSAIATFIESLQLDDLRGPV
jgi:bifunctional DNase/RNase